MQDPLYGYLPEVVEDKVLEVGTTVCRVPVDEEDEVLDVDKTMLDVEVTKK